MVAKSVIPMRVRRRILKHACIVLTMIALLLFSLAMPADAAITTGSSTNANSGSGMTVTLDKPGGTVAGDVLVACIVATSGLARRPEVTPPAGWQLIRHTYATQSWYYDMATYYKVAGISEPSSYTWNSTEFNMSGGITRLAGVDINRVVDVSAEGQGQGDSPAVAIAPSVTTTSANDIVIHFFGSFEPLAAPYFTEEAGLTTLYEYPPQKSNIYNPPNIAAYHWTKTSGGSTGAKTCSMTAAASPVRWVAQTVAFKAAPRAYFPVVSTSAAETGTSHWAGVTLAPDAEGPVEINFTVSGTATPGSDYAMITTSPLTVGTGSGSASIGFNVMEDSLYEQDETIIITLTSGQEYFLTGNTQYVYTITNDDLTAPTPVIAAGDTRTGMSPYTGATFPPPSTAEVIQMYKPTGTAAGDFLLAAISWHSYSSSAINPPTDWNLIQSTYNNGIRVTTYYKIANSSDASVSVYTFGLPATNTMNGWHATGGITRYTGVDTVAPIDVSGAASGSVTYGNTIGAPSVYPNYTNSRVITVFGTYLPVDDISTPSGMIERYEIHYHLDTHATATLIWPEIALSDMNWAPASATGVKTATVTGDTEGIYGSATNWVAQTIALKTSRLSISDVSIAESNSGTTNAIVTVSLDHPTSVPVTFNWLTADGTALVGSDYMVMGASNYVIDAGQTSYQLVVPIYGDTTLEQNEIFYMNLTNVTGATVADSQGQLTILNDDSSITINDVLQNEGNAGTTNFNFTVTLNPVCSLPVSLTYFTPTEGTATNSADYYYTPGTVEFAAGQTTRTITIPVIGDTVFESDETFVVYLSSATNARITDDRGVGTILNDDAPVPTLSINDVSQAEGNSGTGNRTFTVSLSNASASVVSVNYATADGTASAGSDYTSTSGTLNIPAGQTSKTISVPILGDTTYEPNETFYVNLSNPVNATISDSQGLGTITNDDVLTMSINDVNLAEGNSGITNYVFTVTLTGASSSTVTVNYSTADGTATPGPDYNGIAIATLTFNPGDTSKTFTIQVNGDTAYEPDETFLVNLSNANGSAISDGQGVGTIRNDDAAPTYTLSMAVSPNSSGSATDQTGASPYASGTPVSIIASAATGYHFVNWSAPAGSFANANTASTTFAMPAQAVTATAHFALDTYTVTFDSQGGSAVSNQTVIPGGLVVRPADPVRSGYTFVGWYKDAAFTDDWVFAADTVASSITLYARWTVLTPPAVLTHPAVQNITYGANASFSATSNGSPAPTVQWQVSTDGGSSFSNLSNGGVYSGTATTTLTLTRPPFSSSGYRYRAVFANGIAPDATTNSATLTVARLGITGSFTANNKVYDGTTGATVAGQSLTGVLSGDAVTLIGGTATFANKNVGTGKTVTLTGATLSGADAGNYLLASVATATANITAKPVTPSIVANDKAYDGTTTAILSSQTVSGVISPDVVNLIVGAANFANKNVGGDKIVAATSLSLGGAGAGNYSLSAASASDTANITARNLTISGAVGQNKVYDSNITATVDFTGAILAGVIGTDDVDINHAGYSATFNNKHVGNAKPVTVLGVALSGTGSANYTVSQPVGLTANITRLGITGSFTANNKVYDGTTGATVAGQYLTGVLSGDAITLTGGTATFANKNVGTGKTVTLTGATLSGADAGNYLLASVAMTTANITPKPVTPSIVANDKAYDGTTTAILSSQTVSGVISPDVVNLIVGAANFTNKNVGGDKIVAATSLSLGGAGAGNYSLSAASASDTANITARNLTISGAVAQNKTYDGDADATVNFAGATLVGVIAPDVVSINSTNYTAAFNNENVGNSKAVTVLGITLSGTGAANYTVSQPVGLTANITPLGITGSFTAADKVYDGTTDATGAGRSLTGTLPGDVVSLIGGTAAFADKNVGTGKTVTLTGATLSGTDAGNYLLTSVAAATANITPKPVTPSIMANDKGYDGTTTAILSSQTVNGVISPDVATLVVGAANFADKNAGIGKTVTATSLTLGGNDASNYSLSAATASDTASITARNLTIIGAVAQNKPYNGNAAATVNFSGASLVGVVNQDGVIINSAACTAAFSDKNVGNAKPVSVLGVALSGTDKANYTVSQPVGLTANITQLGITGSFTSDNKVYDGNAAAAVLDRSLSGVLTNDAVTLIGGTAAFADKNVGTGKTVTLTGATLSGTDAGNYLLTSVAAATANITPRALEVTAAADTKVYDGTTVSDGTPTITSLSGLVSGDSAIWSQTFDTKDAGTAKELTPAGTVHDGNGGANYHVTFVSINTGVISQAELTLTAENKSSQYSDPRASFTVAWSGFIPGETLAASGVIGSPAYTTNPELSDPITQAPGDYSITPAPGTLAAQNYSFKFISGTYTVTKEDAAITFDSQNPVSVKVVSANEGNSAFIWKVKISPANDGSLGDLTHIDPSDISIIFTSVGPGGGWSGTAKSFDPATGIAVFTVPEKVLGVETYAVKVSLVTDCLDAASVEEVLVIYDPSLGFTTGGGWFIWPAGTSNPELEGAKTNFGFTMKYNRRGTGVQGSFLLIAHLDDGGIIRMKSNAVYGMAIINKTYPGIASFSGKCVYSRVGADGTMLAEAGNQDFTVYVQDMNEPGSGNDMFWFKTTLTIGGEHPFSLDNNSNSKVEDVEYVLLGGGNLVVPHTSSSGDVVIGDDPPPTGGKKK